MKVNDIKNLFPHFDVDTFEHVLGHVSKAAGKIHGLVGDMDHIRDLHARLRSNPDRGTPNHAEAFAAAEKANGKPARAYIADLVICAAKLAALCPSGEIDLERAVADRMAEKREYRKQYTTAENEADPPDTGDPPANEEVDDV